MQRALELPGLRSGLPEILAGADRLQRTVRWVHAGEVPNIASLLKGGELLLTTGYGLGTRPAEQRAFVRTLAERGIAALVVELGPRFTRLPAALVDTARSAGLPSSSYTARCPSWPSRRRSTPRSSTATTPCSNRPRRCTGDAPRPCSAGAAYLRCSAFSRTSAATRCSWRRRRDSSCTPPGPGARAPIRSRCGRGCAASTRRNRPPGRHSSTCPGAAPAPARSAPGWSCCPSTPRSHRCTGSRWSGPPASWPSS